MMKKVDSGKMPLSLRIYSICVALGLLKTISTVFTILTESPQFSLFYSAFLIFPVVEIYGICTRKRKTFIIGVGGSIFLHIIEFLLGGILYGANRLLSIFGSQMAGYFIAVVILLCYLHYSSNVAKYFETSKNIGQKDAIEHETNKTKSIESHMVEGDAVAKVEKEEEPSCAEESAKKGLALKSESLPTNSINSNNQQKKILKKKTSFLLVKEKSTGIIALSIVLILLLFGSNIYQYVVRTRQSEKIKEQDQTIELLEAKRNSLEKKVLEQKQEKEKLQEQYNKLEENRHELFMSYLKLKIDAKYVLDNGTGYYHNFDCPLVQAMKDDDSYWVHNKEYCQHLGYKPCPYCS